MKKIFIILTFFMLLPSFLIAQTPEEKRRVEEKKREDLQSTEAGIPEKAKPQPRPPIEPIDVIYLAELSTRKIAFGYDACKAIVILMGVENEYIDLNSQVSFLKKRGLIPKKFESSFDPMKPLRKGLTAYMFCEALRIKGGIFLRLLGANQRYALKELVFQGIMPSGNVKDIVSGEELILILMQAADYMTKNPVSK